MRASPPGRVFGGAVLVAVGMSVGMGAGTPAHADEPPRTLPAVTDIALRGKPALRVFTDKDGLPQNTVAAQAFDADGRLWVGTQEGLAFYDGHSFQAVPFPGDEGAKWVTALAELSDGTLAVGTHDTGLWFVRGDHFEHVDSKSGLPDDAVLSVAADLASAGSAGGGGNAGASAHGDGDAKGDMWVGLRHGLAHRSHGTWTTVAASELPLAAGAVHAIALAPTEPHRVWVGGDLGVAVLTGGSWHSYKPGENGLPDAHAAYITLDPNDHDRVWVSMRQAGLATLDGEWWRVIGSHDGLPCDDIGPVVAMPGVLWVGTICGGLARIEGDRVSVIDSRNSELQDDLVRSLLAGRASQGPPELWVGTETGGVARVALGGWRAFTAKSSPVRSAVYAFGWGTGSGAPPTVANADVTWIGTENGLTRFDAKGWSDVSIPGLDASEAYVNAVVDARGATSRGLWVATFGGAARLKDGAWTVFGKSSGLPSDIVLTLFEATAEGGAGAESVELLAGMRNGFARFDGERFVEVTGPGAPTSEEVTSMVETRGPSGRPVLWVATASAGLFRREGGTWTNFLANNSPLPNNEVLQVQRVHLSGGRERLFVSTGEAGLAWLDPSSPSPHWFVLSTKTTPALPDQCIYGVQQDREGRIYAFTNHGVARLAERTGVTPEAFAVSVITTEDGLPSNECNSGASAIDPLGRVWAGTVSGAAVLDATTEPDDRASKRLLFEKTLLYDEPFDLRGRPDLAYDQDTLSFELALLSFHRESDTRFRAQLVGLEKEPSAWSPDSKVRYTSLPAGSYELRAWGRDYAGNVSGPIAVQFRVRPAPWLAWWAILGYAVAGVSLVALGVRARFEGLKARARELSERVDARTAELAARNSELAAKNRELDRKNAELLASNERADRIFSAFTDILPGSVLDDKYRIEERIGAGGFATVFSAQQLTLDRRVAVKIFRPAPGNDSAMALDRFQREGMSTCRVNHPNAIQVFDSGISSDGIPYIVMELLEGRTLSSEMRRRGGLPLGRVLELMIPVCEALAAAHAAGLIHRDVKPDNVFLARTPGGETVKLLDFGIAKLVEADENNPSNASNTASAMFVGTPKYMAPERLLRSEYGAESDVYSVGVILYQIILGRPPWTQSTDIFSLVAQIVAGRVVPMTELGVPAPLSALVMNALSADPATRPTAAALASELTALTQTLAAEDLARIYGTPPPQQDDVITISGSSGSRETVTRTGPVSDTGTAAPASATRRLDEPTQAERKRR